MSYLLEGEGPTLAKRFGLRACKITIHPKGFEGVEFELPAQGGGGGTSTIVSVSTEEAGGLQAVDETKYLVRQHNEFHDTLPYAMGKHSDQPESQRVIERGQANVRGRILKTADDIGTNPLIERLYHTHPEFDGLDTTLIQ